MLIVLLPLAVYLAARAAATALQLLRELPRSNEDLVYY